MLKIFKRRKAKVQIKRIRKVSKKWDSPKWQRCRYCNRKYPRGSGQYRLICRICYVKRTRKGLKVRWSK